MGRVTYAGNSVELILVAGISILGEVVLKLGKARVRAMVGHWRRRNKEDQMPNAIFSDGLIVVLSLWRRCTICRGRCLVGHVWSAMPVFYITYRGTHGAEMKRQASMQQASMQKASMRLR